MAPFFSAGQHAYGFIAVGQIATGVIAIGQVATGGIAIGQVARGGIAIGMAAFGVITIGMVSVGLLRSGGIVGIGAGRLFGFVLPLMPMPAKPRRYPESTNIVHIRGSGGSGWLPVELALSGVGALQFRHEGRPLEVRVTAELARAAQRFAAQGRRGLAYLTRTARDQPLVCSRIVEVAEKQPVIIAQT